MGTEVQSLSWFKWTPYAILPLISLFLSVLSLRLGIKSRQTSGAPEFILVCLGIILYSFGYFWEIVSTRPESIIFWDNFQFIGPDLMITSLLFLCLRVANLNRFIHPISILLFSLIPICTELAVWFGKEEWIRPTFRFDNSAPWLALIYEYGPWMQVYVINSIAIFSLCILILIYGAWSQRAFHRIRCLVFMVGISLPFGSQVMTAGGFIPFIHPKLDIFPLTSSFALIVWMYGLFYFRILNLIPLARNQVFEYIQDAVFVMNSSGFLLDCNVAALNLLGTARLKHNSKLSEFLPDLDVLVEECYAHRKTNTEWKTNNGKYYDVSVRSEREEGSQFAIVVLRDVTQRAISERKLSERRDVLQSILDSTSILFLVLDGEGKLILLNRACLQTTGFDLMELEGKVFWETELFADEKHTIAKVFEQRFAKKDFRNIQAYF